MAITRAEVALLALATALLGWAAWTAATVESRVDQDVRAMYARAADRWTALVETGLAPDSVTSRVLPELRARLAGMPWPPLQVAFVPDGEVTWLWQARMLNPFYEARGTMPRDPREAASLLDARGDIRNLLAAARPRVREGLVAEARQYVLLAGAGWSLLVGMIVVRVQRRRRLWAQLSALHVS